MNQRSGISSAWASSRKRPTSCSWHGTGKTHLASAIAFHACQRGHSVLFTTAVDIVNHLLEAQAAHRLRPALKKYLSPSLVVIDELGYIPTALSQIDPPGLA